MTTPSSSQRPESLPPEIERALEAVVARIRRVWWLRGWVAVATVFVAALLIAVAMDWAVGALSTAGRWILLAGVLAATVFAAYRMVWKPSRRELPLLRVARWLEQRHPELDERLSTTVGMPDRHEGVSSSLLDALVTAAVVDVQALDPELEVSRRPLRRWLIPLAGLGAVWLALFLISPGTVARLVARTVVPFADYGNAGALRLAISPGDLEVMEGEEISIAIEVKSKVPESLILVMERDGGRVAEERLRPGEDGRFHYFLAAASESFRYHVRDGREVSDAYRVKVWPNPRLSEPRLSFDYPAYTGIAPTSAAVSGGEIEVLAHTRVTLTGRVPEGVVAGILEGPAGAIPLVFDGDGTASVTFTAEPDGAGERTVYLEHERLDAPMEAWVADIRVRSDAAPVATLFSPLGEQRVNLDDVVEFAFEGSDDIRVEHLAYSVAINGGEEREWPLETPVAGERRLTVRDRLNLSQLAREHSDLREIRVRIKAVDGLPESFGGPGVGYSDPVVLRIGSDIPSLARQELESQFRDAGEKIDEVDRELRAAREDFEKLAAQLAKEAPREATRASSEKALKRLEAATERLEELAEEMPALSEAAKEAAERVDEAREQAETAPLQETAEARSEAMEAAREQTEEALELVEEMKQRHEQQRQEMERQARLNDLAMEERSLSREAAEMAETDPTAELSEAWRKRQEELAAEAAAALEDLPPPEASEAMAQEAEKLAEQARDAAARQEELQRLSAENENTEALEQEGREETAALAEAARELQQESGLPETMQEAIEQTAAAAEAAQEAQAAAEQGDHEKAAEALSKAAEQFEQAAEELRGGQPSEVSAMAEAAEAAAEAAEAPTAEEAALAAQRAAEALVQAAAPPSAPAMPSTPSPGPETATASPGSEELQLETASEVPPELARLGVSAEDWAKIRSDLESDLAGGGAVVIPEDYRELVKAYFGKLSSEDTE